MPKFRAKDKEARYSLRRTCFVALFFQQHAQQIVGLERRSRLNRTGGEIAPQQFRGERIVATGAIQHLGRLHQHIEFGA